jgi:hypothetical protein
MLVLAAAIAQSLYFYFDFVTPKTPPRCTDGCYPSSDLEE